MENYHSRLGTQNGSPFVHDSDSGLSMPSGTFRSSFNGVGGSRGRATPSADHIDETDRVVQSIIQRSLDSPLSVAYLAGYTSSPKPGVYRVRPSSALGESFTATPRASSPDGFSRSTRGISPLDAEIAAATAHRQTQRDESFRSASLTPMGMSNMFTSGLKNALNDSEYRRGTLLDKLKEAQDTLKLQAARLTKMETDYHTSSYQVEELKASESKLVRQIDALEKQKKELNDLRLRDLDAQISLQERIKELEGILQNIASDFQLLEVDHCRRRELVDQLSTTVELVEDENRKLHKMENSTTSEVACLKQEVNACTEEKKNLTTQLDSQRREATHWREETEKQQTMLRQSQETVSELKVKVTSLTHKLENLEAKERQLIHENDKLRSKDSELHDTLTDLKSKVAILTSDKERLYQEKQDVQQDREQLSLTRRNLQDEMDELQLSNRKLQRDLDLREQEVSSLRDKTLTLQDELLASNKVGEKLSQELTRMQKSKDQQEEELSTLKSKYLQTQDRLTAVSMQKDELQTSQQRAQLDQECDKIRDESRKEITTLQRNNSQLQTDLEDQKADKSHMKDSLNHLQQRLSTAERGYSEMHQDYEVERQTLLEKIEMNRGANQRKEEELTILSHKIADYENQITKMACEIDSRSVDFERLSKLQEENSRLLVANQRLTQESTESSHMLQLVQTQRDIYARNVQEYSTKALQADQLVEVNKRLEANIANLRASEELLTKSVKDKEDDIAKLTSVKGELDSMKIQLQEVTSSRDRLQVESTNLKSVAQDNWQLRQDMEELNQKLTIGEKNKTMIEVLGEQNSKLLAELSKLRDEHSNLALNEQDNKSQITALTAQIKALQNQLEASQSRTQQAERELAVVQQESAQTRQQIADGEKYKSEITTLEAQLEHTQRELSAAKQSNVESSHLGHENDLLAKQNKELNNKYNTSLQELETLRRELAQVQAGVKAAKQEADTQCSAAQRINADLSIVQHERQKLEENVRVLEGKLLEYQTASEKQLTSLMSPMISELTGRMKSSEDGRLSEQQKIIKLESLISQLEEQNRRLTTQAEQNMAELSELTSHIDLLTAEVKESNDVQLRQEEVIAALKEETTVVGDLEAELKEARKSSKHLNKQVTEYKGIIASFNKEVEEKQMMGRQMAEISSDLEALKAELQKAYSHINQKDLETERLQKQLGNANFDADNSDEKVAELKIRLEQAEKAKDVTFSTFQERIHCLEAELQTYRTESLKLERQLTEARGQLNSPQTQMRQDGTIVDRQALIVVQAERDSLNQEMRKLRSDHANLRAEQNHMDTEKRQLQLQLKESKMDLFKSNKERDNLERSNAKLDCSLTDCNKLMQQITAEFESVRRRLSEADEELGRVKSELSSARDEMIEMTDESGRSNANHVNQVRQLKDELSSLHENLHDLQFTNDQLKADLKAAAISKTHMEDELITSKRQYSRLSAELDACRKDCEELCSEVELLHQNMRKYEKPVSLAIFTQTDSLPVCTSFSQTNEIPTISRESQSTSVLRTTAAIQTDIEDSNSKPDGLPSLQSSPIETQTDPTICHPSSSQTDIMDSTSRSMQTELAAHKERQSQTLPPPSKELGAQTDPIELTEPKSRAGTKPCSSQTEKTFYLHASVQTDDLSNSKSASDPTECISPVTFPSPCLPIKSKAPANVASSGTDSQSMDPFGRSSPVPAGCQEMNESSGTIEPGDPPTAQMNTSLTDFQEELLLMDETGSSGASGSVSTDASVSPNVSDDVLPDHLTGDSAQEGAWWEKGEISIDDGLFLARPLGAAAENAMDDSEEDEGDQEESGNQSVGTGLTRDKTLKIFKQLKKAKQRSKKCLAPPPKRSQNLELDTVKTRRDSFEAVENAIPDDVDVSALKHDILAKSGKVEWRGDPREPHRRYLSSWDLSIITDIEEMDSESSTSQQTSEMAKSLPNLPAAVSGTYESADNLPSHSDFKLPDRNTGITQSHHRQRITPKLYEGPSRSPQTLSDSDYIAIEPVTSSASEKTHPTDDVSSTSSPCTPGDIVSVGVELSPHASRIPTVSPATSPATQRRDEEAATSKIPRGKPANKSPRVRTNYREALKATLNIPGGGDSSNKLPKLSLFNKK